MWPRLPDPTVVPGSGVACPPNAGAGRDLNDDNRRFGAAGHPRQANPRTRLTSQLISRPVAVLQVDMLANVAVGFGLSYALGFERQLRGSVAGDRTFALVGISAAAITVVAHTTSPQAIAGIVTGIGFIGGGVVFKLRTGSVHGVTTAATILAAAAIGIVAGFGYFLVALIMTAAILLLLEIPSIPFLKWVDARTYMGHVRRDPDLTVPDPSLEADSPGPGPPREDTKARP